MLKSDILQIIVKGLGPHENGNQILLFFSTRTLMCLDSLSAYL